MNMTKKHSGFSLVELVIVIIIIGILAAVGIGFGNKQLANARVTTVGNNVKMVASDTESAIIDLGFLEDVSDVETVKNYFARWDSTYLTCAIDVENIELVAADDAFGSNYSGVKIQTVGYQDSWGMEYRIFYLIPEDKENVPYRIIIASAGPNSIFSEDAETGYVNKMFDDDIVMIMEPRD